MNTITAPRFATDHRPSAIADPQDYHHPRSVHPRSVQYRRAPQKQIPITSESRSTPTSKSGC